MSFTACGIVNRGHTTTPIIQQYIGIDNVAYNVVSRQDVIVSNSLTLDAGYAPNITSTWISGSGSVIATGVILDSMGQEVIKFYPHTIMQPAFSSAPTTVYYPPNPINPFPAGDYTILNFQLTILNPDGRTSGTGRICIAGHEVTPTPTPTFVPTLTPTPTPVPPTPTPTATPVPTLI